MNGAQDLGGMMGFGPVGPEPNEPIFHGAWEKRALAITLAAGVLGEWTLDMGRHARETLPPAEYLTSSYYEIWTKALAKLLLARGLMTTEELATGHAIGAPRSTAKPPLTAEAMAAALAKGTPYDRPATAPARFGVGDIVKTRVMNPQTHTRLPRYARGKSGVIRAVHGVFAFPDSNAHGLGENPHWCYGVAFSARELWGPEADPAIEVMIDCWEPYFDAETVT
jgi:nitrile hydratase beta subunit